MLHIFSIPRKIAGSLKRAIVKRIEQHPFMKIVSETAANGTPVTLNQWLNYKVRRNGTGVYWPVHATSVVSGSWRNVICGIDVAPGIMPGCYIQAIGKIEIGDYTLIGPQVGIISANHSLYDLRTHIPATVKIGSYCWLGMGARIMPGVELGDFTIVAASSVVTHSFPEGHCLLAGTPAKIIRKLEPDKCLRYENTNAYHGFIEHKSFEKFRNDNLNG